MLTRSRPLARPDGLCSGGAEHRPLAVSQTARVFVTTYKSLMKKTQEIYESYFKICSNAKIKVLRKRA